MCLQGFLSCTWTTWCNDSRVISNKSQWGIYRSIENFIQEINVNLTPKILVPYKSFHTFCRVLHIISYIRSYFLHTHSRCQLCHVVRSESSKSNSIRYIIAMASHSMLSKVSIIIGTTRLRSVEKQWRRVLYFLYRGIHSKHSTVSCGLVIMTS